MEASASKRSGFTLIELLVVISIIGLLASIIIASLDTARGKARDARRASDAKSLELALELYYTDHNQYPPGTAPDNQGNNITALQTPLVGGGYIPSISQDPQWANQAKDYEYVRSPGGQAYGLLFYLEFAHGSVPAGGSCLTGQGVNPGWWGPPPQPQCPF
jgi:prepilin-type N-terminal cleavage/methylation domain-containing protein